jgi:tRNA (mo5U34)-methyltransferase
MTTMTTTESNRNRDVSERVEDEIRALGPWFHNLHLPDGRQTCPDHRFGDFPSVKWQQIAPHVPQDLSGWTCLDIGCNSGFYSFELAKRGASVLGIDVDDHYLKQARWACEQFGMTSRVRFERMQVYDLARLEGSGFEVQGSDGDVRAPADVSTEPQTLNPEPFQFDLVLFMGVLYHLRYPMLGLDIVCQKVRRLMVFQTLTMPGQEVFQDTHNRDFDHRDLMLEPGWPKMAFLEHHFAGDPTNWWAPNHAGVEAMLRSAGMRVTSRPGHEIYFCEPDPQRPSCVATWNAAELKSATGRPWQS